MNVEIKKMDELKDSRIMFDKKIHPFGYFIVIIIFVAIVFTVIWSAHAIKPYMILTSCTVTDSDSNYVMSPYTGEIIESYMDEGDVVIQGDVLFKIKSTDYDVQLEQLESTRENYEKQVEKYKLLVKSVKDDTNYFSQDEEDELYYSTFEAYKSQVAQNTVDVNTYKAYGYSDEQIEVEMLKNEGKISEIYYSTIQNAENAVKEANTQINSIDSQIAALGNGKTEYTIKATETGVLHLNAEYKKGMVVQTASVVASITPENSDMILEGNVSTVDMARIEEGNNVQIAVDGLSQNIYGNIKGKVVQIDSNASSIEDSEGRTASIFRIKIKPDINYVVSKSGKKVNLSNGMTCETRIRYDEVTYLDYVLEKLGILVR